MRAATTVAGDGAGDEGGTRLQRQLGKAMAPAQHGAGEHRHRLDLRLGASQGCPLMSDILDSPDEMRDRVGRNAPVQRFDDPERANRIPKETCSPKRSRRIGACSMVTVAELTTCACQTACKVSSHAAERVGGCPRVGDAPPAAALALASPA